MKHPRWERGRRNKKIGDDAAREVEKKVIGVKRYARGRVRSTV